MRYKKKIKIPPVITIYFDDREKHPWMFLNQNGFKLIRQRLAVGDYSIKGLEDKVSIEKKSSLQELLSNLSSPGLFRFEKFLSRLSKYPVKCIIVNESLTTSSLNYALKVLHKKSRESRITADVVYYWVAKIISTYGIPVLFLDNRELTSVLPVILRTAYEKARRL